VITVLTHGRLLDCVGDEPIEDVSIVVEEGEIKDIYSGGKPLPDGATVINVGGRAVLPGLTDAHEHPTFTGYGVYKSPVMTAGTITSFLPPNLTLSPIMTAVRIMQNLNLDLQAGFTTVCSKDGANWALKHAVEEGAIKGPRLLIACSMISKTGGHWDFSNFRGGLGEAVIKDTGLVTVPRIADGIDDCRKAAREQLRNGADLIKIAATGGAGSPNAEATDVGYSEEEIRAFVEEAEDNGKYVAAHCLNNKGIKRSIKCGVRSIDHGVYFDEEAARMLKERDFFHVPTLLEYKLISEQSGEVRPPDYFIRKATALLDETMRSVEITYRLKCNVGSGSDCSVVGHGTQGAELKLKTECGMTPYEAIKSATIVNARLFRMEDKIGTLEIGKWADIIAVDGHPDEDVELLSGPKNVRLVMKGGEIMKNTL